MESATLHEHDRRLADHDRSVRELHREQSAHGVEIARLRDGQSEVRENVSDLKDFSEREIGSLRRAAYTASATFLVFTATLAGFILDAVLRG